MVRETPFHLGHLKSMTAVTEMGAIVAPPIPCFYNNPLSIEDLVDSSVDRVLDLMGVPDEAVRRRNGPRKPGSQNPPEKEGENPQK
jgi:4-hydroxy-3-polyprenylbenzoate decarboxylase